MIMRLKPAEVILEIFPKSQIGVDIEKNFEPEYKVITAKKRL